MVFEGSRISTPLDAIFGGTTFNAVKCSEWSNITSKVEPFLDLSLEISKSRTLQGALASHFGAEVLTGENMFFCSPCNKNVDATRATRIERPPLALSLHLKRFSGTLKNSKPIQICTTLEVTKFVRGAREAGISYQYCLQNMIHHEGSNAHDGHYYTIGLADDGVFYKFDERDVNPIDVEDQMKSHTLYVATFKMTPKSKESLLASLLAEKKKEDEKLAKEQNLEEEKLATKKNEQQREEGKLSEEKMKPELKLATEKLLEEKVAAKKMEEEKLHAVKMKESRS